MKNITKTIITTVLLLLTVGLFAQDSTDDKAIVKDALGISTGLTKAELEKFKQDYKTALITESKYQDINRVADWMTEVGLKYRINLKVINELIKLKGSKDIGAFFASIDNGFGYLSSYCTFWGEITAFSKDEKFFYITVKEIIRGEEYLKAHYGETPKVIKVGNYVGTDDGVNLGKNFLKTNIFSLMYDEIKMGADGELYFPSTQGDVLYRLKDKNFKPTSEQLYIGGMKLEDYLYNYKKSAELNDEKNFYKRQYSAKGDK